MNFKIKGLSGGMSLADNRSMTYKQALKTLTAVAGLALGVSQASAVEITTLDYTGPQTSEANNGITGVWGPSWGWNGGPLGKAGEDNEVEATSVKIGSVVGTGIGARKGQMWDLEGMSVSGNHLYLVGGFDFGAGLSGGLPGDLFIKLGSAGTFKPLSDPSGGSFLNGSGGPGYNFAVQLSNGLGSGAPVSVNAFGLSNSSLLVSDINDAFGSNPWKYNATSDKTSTTGISATYKKGLTAAQVAGLTGEAAFGNLLGDTDGSNLGGYSANGIVPQNSHNVLDLDMTWLFKTLTKGTDVFFSYTMECGNDQLKGHYVAVPDGGASLIFLGGALSTLFVVGRRFRK
jgi:hypothetical protein